MRVLKCDITNLPFAAWNVKDIHSMRRAAIRDINCVQSLRIWQFMKHSVRGRDDRHLRTGVGKCCGQFAHDIANPTDLAAGQRTIFSRYEYDVFLADDG